MPGLLSLSGRGYVVLHNLTSNSIQTASSLERLNRRHARRFTLHALWLILTAGILITLVIVVLYTPARRTVFVQRILSPDPLPPLYPEFREAERSLPQHASKNPFANGQKYLWIAGHTTQSGWGNFMQDMIMNAHLTYASGRTYVFDDYTWDRDGPAYSIFNGNLIPSRIPLSAMISGPIVGGSFSKGDPTPLSIAKSRWQQICPRPHQVNGDEVRAIHGGGASALKIVETWVEYLSKIDDPCVEVPRHSGNLFHIFMFGNKDEMLPVWPTLSKSPILTLFGWSTLAHTAFQKNRGLFSPAPVTPAYVGSLDCPHCLNPDTPLDGLLAVHLRRGDFLEHCANLCHWGASFNAFNRFPEFPDQWEGPDGEEDYRMSVYLRRCVPSIEQIVHKVEEVRKSSAGQGLRNIYIMTNGDIAWLAELKVALRRSHPWEHIATSRDLILSLEEKYVAQTMDMMVGQRAQVLIGNGFSSLTSNVAMLRVSRGFSADSTRMW